MSQQITREFIEAAACKFFEIKLDDLYSKDRFRPEVHYRFVVWKMLREKLKYKTTTMGKIYHRDRTSISYGIKQVGLDPVIESWYKRFEQFVVENMLICG